MVIHYITWLGVPVNSKSTGKLSDVELSFLDAIYVHAYVMEGKGADDSNLLFFQFLCMKH